MLTGGVLFGFAYPQVLKLNALANYGTVTMPDLWGVSPYLMVILLALASLVLFYLLERGLGRKDKME